MIIIIITVDLKFNDESEMILIDEIAEYDDALALQLHVLDASSNDRLGSANVELWVMIEDSVNILRQEVEVMNNDLSDSIGYVYIDLKGFRLLKKCANRVRSQRKNRNK